MDAEVAMSMDGRDNLLVVEKHRLGDTPEEVKPFSNEREELLRAAVRENGGVEKEDPQYQRFLKRLYNEEVWIGCPCRDGTPFEDAPVPLMTVQNRERYNLLRLPKRPAHADGCLFEAEGPKSDPQRKEGSNIEERGVCFHRRIGERTERREGTTNGRSGGTNLRADRSSLEQLLYELLDRSGLNRTEGTRWERKEAFGRIYRVAGSFDLASTFKVQDYLWVRPWKLVDAAKQLREDWEMWPDTSAHPHAIFVFQAEEVNGQTIIYDVEEEEEHEVQDELEIRSPDMRGPYLVLMTISDSKERPKYMEPRRAFGVPIVGEPRYFPVWSRQEREIVLYAIEEIEAINRDLDNPLQLQKPLKSTTTRLGDCLPDLRLKWRGENIVVRLVKSMEAYVGEKESQKETLDYNKLNALGRPLVIETEGEVGIRLVKRFRDSVNEELEIIRQDTGGSTSPEL
ncbi:hypothetical protein [Salinibacter ruber]|jgi:hypothetical protein|uniref:Uncharacterized protein n=1 Tax=Salinibacter ruber TaxID=146919 RepID=A0A9X2Q1M7_9BACT|nr:hypothetical protein [Salinibacter ruber]MCS3709879.1 hypothetical protein [Salinibacter ruber]MCS4170293.1 hypothetical protein [Salinibacter ruber]